MRFSLDLQIKVHSLNDIQVIWHINDTYKNSLLSMKETLQQNTLETESYSVTPSDIN